MVLYVLFEHASGYAVFKVVAQEEVGVLLPEVQESVQDLGRFGKLIKLVAFNPFKSAANALDNINCISEGVVHDDLKLFLESNVPTGKKKSKITLGISDSKLAASIIEAVNIQCDTGGIVTEILRGIRVHFHKLITGLSGEMAGKAQLGLGHSYSRAKVKFNVHRSDNMIIQSIALLDQLDKDINTFAMRIREWYSYHFPELIKIVSDNYLYARVAQLIGARNTIDEEKTKELEELLMDEAKAAAIVNASKSSMGMDISPIDLINIESFASRVVGLAEYRKSLHTYLSNKMESVAPNLSTVIGDQVGARLISHAGSLTNLAKYPASTVQILGAEKALFRALKKKGNTPKYGLIFHSSFIGRAGTKNKGRISRYLANKCSIASRIDCFAETPSNVFGEKLRDQVEERLKFYEDGVAPRKNVDVMQEAIAEFSKNQKTTEETPKKKSKKTKKVKTQESGVKPDTNGHVVEDSPEPPLKKKKIDEGGEDTTTPRKKKKKDKQKTEDAEETPVQEEKKKKKKKSVSVDEVEQMETTQTEGTKSEKKKKKSLGAEEENNNMETSQSEEPQSAKKKKKKSKSVA